MQNIQANGGKVENDKITLAIQQPKTVKLEQGFRNVYPIEKTDFNRDIKEVNFEFEGTGFSVQGEARKKDGKSADYIFEAELYIDGKKVETAKLPTSYTTRRLELFWNYSLPKQKHTVSIKVLNPNNEYELKSFNYIVFSDKPVAK